MWNSDGSGSEICLTLAMNGIRYHNSPVGRLVIESQDDAITKVGFPTTVGIRKSEVDEISTAVIEQCIAELDEYFQNGRKVFTVQLKFIGTDFQKSVWTALLNVPFGKTRAYMDIAVQLDNPGSVRAVGMANNQNPIAIIVPCHRVIGKDGSMVGYGGGLEKKTWLLRHEGALTLQTEMFETIPR